MLVLLVMPMKPPIPSKKFNTKNTITGTQNLLWKNTEKSSWPNEDNTLPSAETGEAFTGISWW